MLYSVYFFLGIGIIAYPYVSRSISAFYDQQYINYYQNQANQKNDQELAELQQKQAKKNKQLSKEGNTPGVTEFNRALNAKKNIKKDKDYFEQHTIASLSIPKIDVHLPIFDQTNDILLQKGATLLDGTSIPIGGPSTHAVLSAHRGFPEATLFDRLPELKKKDLFYIMINRETHAYQVDEIKVIEPTDVSDLTIIDGKDYVTLMTCTPYMVNTHRLLVRGHRVPYVPEVKKQLTKQNNQKKNSRLLMIIGAGAFILLLLWLLFKKKKRKKQ